jgi:hypothetical protein
MPNRVPAAHLVAGIGSLHAALSGAVQATICPSSIEIVSLNLALPIAATCLIGELRIAAFPVSGTPARGVLEYEPEVRNTATSKQNVEGTAK